MIKGLRNFYGSKFLIFPCQIKLGASVAYGFLPCSILSLLIPLVFVTYEFHDTIMQQKSLGSFVI